MLQESDMFMDALTASTKSKEPRKRKRRTSVTKDGSSEAKKQEIANNADNRESTPPPGSPSNADEKAPVALKPNFKVNIFRNESYIHSSQHYTVLHDCNTLSLLYMKPYNVRVHKVHNIAYVHV